MTSRKLFFGVLLAMVCRLAVAIAAGRSEPAAQRGDSPTESLELLRGGDGKLTPAVHASYVEWAKREALEQLKAESNLAFDDAVHEIESDPTLADAVFASVYPPDKSILRNYVDLRSNLGAKFERSIERWWWRPRLSTGAAVCRNAICWTMWCQTPRTWRSIASCPNRIYRQKKTHRTI
jgi:hypothetical protein